MTATTIFGTPVIQRMDDHTYWLGDKGPFPGVTRMCGLQDAFGGSDGLLNWAAKIVLETQRRTYDATGDWEEAQTQAWKAKDAARQLGSAVHKAVDRVNHGLPLETNERTAPYLAQYGAFAIKHRLRVVGSEQYVINTTIGYGGTLDLLAEIDGDLALLDVKTGKAKDSQRLQLTGLSMGEFKSEPGDEPEPMPAIDTAYILLLHADSFQLIRHEITQSDRDHFTRLVEFYHRVQEWRERGIAA